MSDIREAFEEVEQSVACGDMSAAQVFTQMRQIAMSALQSQTAPAVPEEWMLVPVEPTDEMLRKSNWSGNGDVSVNEEWARRTVWDRMLAAAPQPAHSPGGGGAFPAYGLHHVSRMYQVMRKHDSTIDDAALDSMRDTLRHVLAAAPQPDHSPDAGKVVPDSEFSDEFAKWWEDHGQFVRAGGGNYERTFAFEAWRHLYPRITTPAADGGEVEPVGYVSQRFIEAEFLVIGKISRTPGPERVGTDGQKLEVPVYTHPAQPRNEDIAADLEAWLSQVRHMEGLSAHDIVESAEDYITLLRSNGGDV